MTVSQTSVLIIEANFYEDISNELVRGSTEELRKHNINFERVAVPGALEIPQALASAISAGLFNKKARYQGCIALGCVIRGETQHNEIVGNESARALLDISITKGIALGNGILTVNDREQAWARASVDGKNKGADAANACVRLMELSGDFERKSGLKT